MASKVIWTQAAWSDLEEIANFIAKDSPRYANSFVQDVKEAAQSLNQFSHRGCVVPEYQNQQIREVFLKNYRLIYKIDDLQIYILGVVHMARDM